MTTSGMIQSGAKQHTKRQRACDELLLAIAAERRQPIGEELLFLRECGRLEHTNDYRHSRELESLIDRYRRVGNLVDQGRGYDQAVKDLEEAEKKIVPALEKIDAKVSELMAQGDKFKTDLNRHRREVSRSQKAVDVLRSKVLLPPDVQQALHLKEQEAARLGEPYRQARSEIRQCERILEADAWPDKDPRKLNVAQGHGAAKKVVLQPTDPDQGNYRGLHEFQVDPVKWQELVKKSKARIAELEKQLPELAAPHEQAKAEADQSAQLLDQYVGVSMKNFIPKNFIPKNFIQLRNKWQQAVEAEMANGKTRYDACLIAAKKEPALRRALVAAANPPARLSRAR